jgi:hypothetical protein
MISRIGFHWWRQTEPSPFWDGMLQQELAIADWCPKKRKTQTSNTKKDFLCVMSRETEQLLEKNLALVVASQKYWKDQVQVALWANQILQEEWFVHVLYDKESMVPYYYFVLSIDDKSGRVEMKGIWKSLYGTLSLKQYPHDSNAFTLLSWAFSEHGFFRNGKTTVYVSARIGLERLLMKHGIKLCYVEKRIPKAQGASVIAQFQW